MFKLLKKIWFYLKGVSNDVVEKNTNPAVELRQVARELGEERDRRRKAFVDAHTRIALHRDAIEHKEKMFDDAKLKAKQLKASGDDKAMGYAERCVTLQTWIERMKIDVERGEAHLEFLKKGIEELEFQKENLELEASLADSNINMSQFEIKNASDSGVGKNYDSIIDSARKKVREVQASAESHRVAFDTFNEGEKSSASADAHNFLENL